MAVARHLEGDLRLLQLPLGNLPLLHRQSLRPLRHLQGGDRGGRRLPGLGRLRGRGSGRRGGGGGSLGCGLRQR